MFSDPLTVQTTLPVPPKKPQQFLCSHSNDLITRVISALGWTSAEQTLQTRGLCTGTLALPLEGGTGSFSAGEGEHPLAQQLPWVEATCAPGSLSWKWSCFIWLKILCGLMTFWEKGLAPILLHSHIPSGFVSF